MTNYFADLFSTGAHQVHRIASWDEAAHPDTANEQLSGEEAEPPNVQQLVTQDNNAPATPQPFRLMDLPPEMRNRIYRFALCSESNIIVSRTGYERPGITFASRQVRKECLAIYYLENRFALRTYSYDSTAAHRFWKTVPTLKSKPRLHNLPSYRMYPHWQNLLVWLERHHNGEVSGISKPERQVKHKSNPTDVVVVAGLFATVSEMRDLPWLRVKGLLEVQRPVLVRTEKKWATDHHWSCRGCNGQK